MQWHGKINGFLVGSAFDPIGAAIGALMGHFYDHDLQAKQSKGELEYRTAVLAVAASAALANGSVHPNERKRLMIFGRVLFETATENEIISRIDQIIGTPMPVARCAEIFSHLPDDLKPALITELFSILYADSIMEDSERQWINQLILFSRSDPDLWREVAIYFEHYDPSGADRKKCLAVFNLPTDASDEQIKKTYRNMAMEYHPDRLVGVPEAIKALAENKPKELNAAYEALTHSHGSSNSLSNYAIKYGDIGWVLADAFPADVIMFCPLCSQQNRPPQPDALMRARCERCYALLLFPKCFLPPDVRPGTRN